MKYNVRECPIKFDLTFGNCDGTQNCEFEINGNKYSWWLSYAMGDLFGSMLRIAYGLCIEIEDHRRNDWVVYEHGDPMNNSRITAITGSSRWDNEGETLEWTFRRDLTRKDRIIEMKIDYQLGKKVYEDTILLDDLCYAVTRALTNYIKQVGFCGYQLSAVYDSIDIVQFITLKHFALTGEMECFSEDFYGGFTSSFEDEMALIRHEM